MLQLTREQKIRDYEYLWGIIRNCFPVAGVMKRMGYDCDALQEKHWAAVVESADDLAFCRAMQNVINEFKEPDRERYLAHLRLFEPARFRNYQKMYEGFMAGAWESADANEFAPWVNAVNQEHSNRFYSQFDEESADGGFHLKGQAPTKLAPEMDAVFGDQSKPNVRCAMLPGQVALISVEGLNMFKIPGDREIIFDFYKKHGGCRHLVLDFRRNGGGATDYWHKLLVAPTIHETLEYDTYGLFPVREENYDFVKWGLNGGLEIDDPKGKVRPVSELPPLPAFPALHREDLEQLTHFRRFHSEIKPDQENHFEAPHIWVLVSKSVYSSAEAFAVFCRSTGWATLVGERTGGDGVGITPYHAVLPESGLVMRYSGENGLNADGGSNVEHCTPPDIECKADDALLVCLAEIARREELAK